MYLLAAQLLRNLGPLLVIFFLARLTPQETVGQYSLALAIATPFFSFGMLNLRTVTLTLTPEARFSRYVLVQCGGALFALVLSVVVSAVGVPELVPAMLLVSLLKTADAFSDFLSGPLQRSGRAGTILVASLVAAVLVSAMSALTLVLTRELLPTLLTLAVGSLGAMYLFLFRPARSVARARESHLISEYSRTHHDIKRILAAGLPLGLSVAIMALISTVPQYIVTANQGPSETARLAVLLYLYALADIVTATVSQAWIPHAQFSVEQSKHRHAVSVLALRASLKWLLVYTPLTLAGLFAAIWAVPAVFGADYTLSPTEALPLGLAILFLPFAHFFGTAVAIRNYYSQSITLAVGAAIVSIVVGIVAIPAFGVAGAFWAVLVSVLTRGALAAFILVIRSK